MAQLVKCLACTHEDLNSIPRTQVRKPGIVVHTCNPRTREAETSGSMELTDQQALSTCQALGQREALVSKTGMDSAWQIILEVHMGSTVELTPLTGEQVNLPKTVNMGDLAPHIICHMAAWARETLPPPTNT